MKIYSINNYNNNNRVNFSSRIIPNIATSEVKQAALNITKNNIILSETALAGFKNAIVSKNNDFELKELTEEECKQKKAEVENAKINFPSIKDVYTYGLNEWNIQLLEYMLKNPDTYKENHEILVSTIASRAWKNPNTKLQAEVILKLLKMPWLFTSRAMEFVVPPIVWYTENNDAAEIKIKLLDKISENPRQYSDTQLKNIAKIVGYIDNEEGYELAEKIIQDPQLLEVCLLDYTYWLRQTGDKRNGNIKSAMIDKIQSKPELIERPYFKEGVIDILNTTDDENKLQLALKILENPIFFESKSFVKSIKNLLKNFPNAEDDVSKNVKDLMFNIMDAVIQRPKLFENEDFLNDLGELIFIQKKGDSLINAEQQISNGKKNLFLIENGYYI